MREYENEIDEDILGQKYKKIFDQKVSEKVIQSFEVYMEADRCLEIGCYNGSVTSLLVNRYSNVTAIDASIKSIKETARLLANKSSVQLINQTIEQFLEKPKTKSDTNPFSKVIDIFLMNIIEHLENPQAVLSSLNRKTKIGSKIFIQVPNVDSLSRRIASMMGVLNTTDKISEFEWNCGHRHNFSFDSMEHLIRETGFEIITCFGRGLKTLSSAQLDKAEELGIIDKSYIEALFKLDQFFPTITGSICFVAVKR